MSQKISKMIKNVFSFYKCLSIVRTAAFVSRPVSCCRNFDPVQGHEANELAKPAGFGLVGIRCDTVLFFLKKYIMVLLLFVILP